MKEARRILLESHPFPGTILWRALSFLQSPCDDPTCLHALSPCSRCGLVDVCPTHDGHRQCPHCARPSHRRNAHGNVCAPSSKALRKWRLKYSSWLDALRYAQERIPNTFNSKKSYLVKIGITSLFPTLRRSPSRVEVPTHLGATTPYRTLRGFRFAPLSSNIDVLASLTMVLVLSTRGGNRALISFDRNASALVLGNALYHHLVSPISRVCLIM